MAGSLAAVHDRCDEEDHGAVSNMSEADESRPRDDASSAVPGPAPDIASAITRLGSYVWIEARLFEVVGAWVTTTPEPAAKVYFGAVTTELAGHAQLWHERLPQLREVSRESLIVAPGSRSVAVMDALASIDGTVLRLEALAAVVDHLLGVYAGHERDASVVRDAPMLRTVAIVCADHRAMTRSAPALCKTLVTEDTTGTPRSDQMLALLSFLHDPPVLLR